MTINCYDTRRQPGHPPRRPDLWSLDDLPSSSTHTSFRSSHPFRPPLPPPARCHQSLWEEKKDSSDFRGF